MKVSVITPSYNQGRFIERTLQSVASQTGVTVEHAVFDGGSTDGTVEILKNFSPAPHWVSRRDKGQTDAVNQGIRATDGEIIGWLNSDDVYYPGAIARAVHFFEAHPDVDLVYGAADHIDIDGNAFESYATEPWDFERLQLVCFICQPAVFFRRSVVGRFGLLDETLHYCMDYEYWLRLGKAGAQFAYLEDKLAGSRLYADNKTLGARVKVHREINEMFARLFGTVPDRWLMNYAHAVVESEVDRRRLPRWFLVRLVASTLAAAWRWNGGASSAMKMELSSWARAAFQRR
jgi:glycosyltransferase involved in cell wall biosynthesis